MGKSLFKTKAFSIFIDKVWENNPIFIMVLGICSSLAVTTNLTNALVMGLSVVVVLGISSFLISLIRNYISDQVRLITFMLIISTFVITVDFILKIYVPDISKALGPYIGLIITNCILMGRAEAFASKNPPFHSLLDAVGSGLGYTLVLLLLALIREFLSWGTLFGSHIIESWVNWNLMSIAPGAFFVLGVIIIFSNMITTAMKRSKQRKKQ
ncbi:MAG: electron transport complex subunit RsxE [Spirochaetales bacterium]|nr:electron transport complex subunit RsxE [Spirochaetales bacterium]